MKKQTAKKAKPVLIWRDQASIDMAMQAAENGLPIVKAILDAWKAIPGMPEFTADDFKECFWDKMSFVEKKQDEYYETNHGANHRALGIGPERGKNLVHETLPVFTSFLQKIKDYEQTYILGSGRLNPHCATPDAYTVQDGEIVIDHGFADKVRATHELWFNTETELKCKKAIENLCAAIKTVHQTIPHAAFKLTNNGFGPLQLDGLYNILNAHIPHGGQEYVFEPKEQFYFNLHNVVVRENLE